MSNKYIIAVALQQVYNRDHGMVYDTLGHGKRNCVEVCLYESGVEKVVNLKV